ncbi:hypothetical protein ANN_00653 [Periplaneta americana]|uniref:Uncharacterized protein n=1 Tax=Periplaneta americana TaxID=6978 RepID=A0ABQ8TT37_PERAM|nr:hypothetical protein ANN_00653 [Periplaneta americana]
MAVLCEGDSEPAGPLKAIFTTRISKGALRWFQVDIPFTSIVPAEYSVRRVAHDRFGEVLSSALEQSFYWL